MLVVTEALPAGIVGHPRQLVFCEYCGSEILPEEWAEYIPTRHHRSPLAVHATTCDREPPPPTERAEEGWEGRVEARVAVRQAILRLPWRERVVLALRYGLDGGPALTLREVGEALRVSHERVRQIQTRGYEHLRAVLEGTPPPPRLQSQIPRELLYVEPEPLPGIEVETLVPDWLLADEFAFHYAA